MGNGRGAVEDVVKPFGDIYRGKRVLVTGHTGFKGSWLAFWLRRLGAEVGGFALDPLPGCERLFQCVLDDFSIDRRGDIRDAAAVSDCLAGFRPDFVFHLAAQPLVLDSYRQPVETVAINILGTAHLLEAVRCHTPNAHTVIVTTDKCYENREWCYPYREIDPLGGRDVYSASKAGAEIVTAAWRHSFFETPEVPGRVATARGGNVIGGGDYAEFRIVPDAVRALSEAKPIEVRNPCATRPWQHVLDCLSGYLTLGAWLAGPDAGAVPDQRAFNFGPAPDCERPVRDLVEEVLQCWPGDWTDASDPDAAHEASRLSIAIDRAASTLGWRPSWDFPTTIRKSISWYRLAHENPSPADLRSEMEDQINGFMAAAG